MEKLTVCWLSGGVSSFISAYLVKEQLDELIYIDIEDQHEDTLRFVKECANKIGVPLTILKSPYGSVENVINQFQYINGPAGAKCTEVLKRRERAKWEEAHKDKQLVYVWGYDYNEERRIERIQESLPHAEHIFPLRDKGIDKDQAHGMLKMLNIKRPKLYDMGYPNNNCVGCVKGSLGYWNKIRQDFPEVFKRRAELERRWNRSCILVKGEKVFLDELEQHRGLELEPIKTFCGMSCISNVLSKSDNGSF